MARCYLHDQPGECWPRMDRAHLIPKQVIKRQFVHGAMWNEAGKIRPQSRIEDFVGGGETWKPCSVDNVIWDPRVWVWACRYHHGQLDSGAILLPRRLVPASVISFADEYLLMWYVDRQFPHPREVAA